MDDETNGQVFSSQPNYNETTGESILQAAKISMAFSILAAVPTRAVVGVMIFLAGMFAYMLTFNFSISLLAMVQARHDTDNGTAVDELPDVSRESR